MATTEPPPQRSDDGVIDLSEAADSIRFSPATAFAVQSPSEDGSSVASAGETSSEKVGKALHEFHEFFLCKSCQKNPILQGAVPKLLPCLHTFCDSCLKTHYLEQKAATEASGKVSDEHRLRCPSCWQEFYSPSSAIDSFSDNQFITEASQPSSPVEEQAVVRTCTSCDDQSSAAVFCVDCSDWLCSVCHEAHQRVKVTKDHTIQDEPAYNRSVAQSNKQGKPVACQLHPNETLKLFCTDCDALTCRDCQLGQHKDHKYEFMDEAASKHKEVLAKLLKHLERNVVLLRDTLDDVDKAGGGLKARELLIEGEIKKEIGSLVDFLREREKMLIQDLKQLTKSKLSLLMKQRKDLKQMSSILRHNYNFATFAIFNGSNSALLQTRKILLTRLNNLNSLRYRQRPLACGDIKLLLDHDKIKAYFSRVGYVYSQDDIKRKAENSSSRNLPLRPAPTGTNGVLSARSMANALSNHHQAASQSNHAPQLIALSSQGMPYAKVAPTTVSTQNNGNHQNAVIVLQPGADRARQHVATPSPPALTQLLKRKYNEMVNGNTNYNRPIVVSSSQAHPSQSNGDPTRRDYTISQGQSPGDCSIDKISVSNVTSLNPSVSRAGSSSASPQHATTSHATAPHASAQPSQIVVVKAEKGSPASSCGAGIGADQHGSPSMVVKQGVGREYRAASQESSNDDYCSVCRNGGELLCCDTCPRVFHLTCHIPAVIQLPYDTWSCNLCRKPDPAELDKAHKRRPSLNGLSEQDTRVCEKLLLEIFCHRESTPFHHKVSKAVPNYHQIITHPMDLTTMRSKLQASHFQRYESVQEFGDDMMLIFSNCATFNPPTSEVARMGKTVSAYFQKILKQNFPQCVFNSSEESRAKRRRDEFILS